MSATEQVLIEKIRQLPPQRLAEVEDFVDFLRTREDDQRLTQAAARASERGDALSHALQVAGALAGGETERAHDA